MFEFNPFCGIQEVFCMFSFGSYINLTPVLRISWMTPKYQHLVSASTYTLLHIVLFQIIRCFSRSSLYIFQKAPIQYLNPNWHLHRHNNSTICIVWGICAFLIPDIVVMSDFDRFPVYFSVIMSMLKYYHRLDNTKECLLYDAYLCNKLLHSCKINTWYSSIVFILKEIDLSISNMKRKNRRFMQIC